MNVVVDVPQPVEGAKMQDSIFYYDTSGSSVNVSRPNQPSQPAAQGYYYQNRNCDANQQPQQDYGQPNSQYFQSQPQQPSHAQSQPQPYYVGPEYANHPHVTYDPASGMYICDPRQPAASQKRPSDMQTAGPTAKRQKTGPTVPAVEVIDLDSYYPSAAPGSLNSGQPSGMSIFDVSRTDKAAPKSIASYARPPGSHTPANWRPGTNSSSAGEFDFTTQANLFAAKIQAAITATVQANLRAAKCLARAGALKDNNTALPSPPQEQQPPFSYQANTAPRKVQERPSRAYHTPAPSSPTVPHTLASAAASVVVPVGTFGADTSFSAPPPSYIPLEDNAPMPSWFQESTQPPRGTVPTSLSGETEPPLCAEQQELVNLILSGKNVFYTGSAGCGKSTVLKAFTKQLRAMGKQVDIVAPTGRAALQVNGSTTWSYAGWTPNHHKKPLKELRELANGKFVWKRLTKTDVLVIDEISMVENLHLERLNEIMKAARHRAHHEDEAFGGVQVILTGDFCQLPPVKPFQHCIECGNTLVEGNPPSGKNYSCRKTTCRGRGQWRDEDKWAFRSKAWEECNFVHFQLTQVHRQSDELFIRMLQKCRRGLRLSEEDIDILMNHKVSGVKNATQLHAVRSEVEKVNKAQFDRLKTICHTYYSLDLFSWRQDLHPHLRMRGEPNPRTRDSPRPEAMPSLKSLNDHRFDECVQLKQGMLVVLLVNLDLGAGLCNGSQGTICGWEALDPANLPKAYKPSKKNDAPEPGKRISGDRAEMKEDQIGQFIAGQPEYRVVGGGQRVEQKKAWPVVRFHNGEKRTIYAECSVTELGDEKPYSLLARTQIPLAPAWAMTIHKSQGMTLDKVVVNLSRAFEEGQVYVALSRARSLDGLKIDGDANGLRGGLGGNEQVQRFFREKFGMGEEEREVGDSQDSAPGESSQLTESSQS